MFVTYLRVVSWMINFFPGAGSETHVLWIQYQSINQSQYMCEDHTECADTYGKVLSFCFPMSKSSSSNNSYTPKAEMPGWGNGNQIGIEVCGRVFHSFALCQGLNLDCVPQTAVYSRRKHAACVCSLLEHITLGVWSRSAFPCPLWQLMFKHSTRHGKRRCPLMSSLFWFWEAAFYWFWFLEMKAERSGWWKWSQPWGAVALWRSATCF